MDTKSRINWIDIARGIGIILVIYGHAIDGNASRHLIYAFHMPLFFFISGVVFRHKVDERFLPFLKKSAKNLVVPYFGYGFIIFLWWLVASHPSVQYAWRQFLSLFYGSGSNGGLAFDTVLWFLPCLFITRVGFWIVTKYIQKPRNIALVLWIFSIVGYLFSKTLPNVEFPFGIEIALNAIVFFGAGYLFVQKEAVKEYVSNHKKILFGFCLFITILFASINFHLYHHQIDLRLNRLDNYFFFYIAAFSGTLSTIALSMWIGKNRMFEYLGKKALILFIWHPVVFWYFTRILRNFFDPQLLNEWRNTYLSVVYTVGSIVIILGVAIVIQQIKNKISPQPSITK